MDDAKGLAGRRRPFLLECLDLLEDLEEFIDLSLSVFLERRLSDVEGLFASSDILTLGRTILAGGRRVALGLRALEENSTDIHSLLTLVASMSLMTPLFRMASGMGCC